MKVILRILSIAICLGIYGCTDKFETDDREQSNVVQFRSNMDVSGFSRGTPLSAAADMQNMAVYGYFTGTDTWAASASTAVPNFFCGQVVTNSGYSTNTTSWTYSPIIYWPAVADSKVTFQAYAPARSATNGVSVVDSIGGLTLNYVVPITCKDQPDLMMTVPVTDQSTGTVSFEMQHMLACIGLSATGMLQEIDTIYVKGIATEGTVTYNSDTSEFEWELGTMSGENDYMPIIVDTLLAPPLGYVQINTSDGYLMLPPQTLTSTAQLQARLKDGTLVSFGTSDTEWKAGQKYNYQLDLTIPNDQINPYNIESAYVGAFWRYNETGERVIRMNNTGDWSATIFRAIGDWEISDFLIDYLPSDYNTAIGTALPSTIQQMTSSKEVVTGTGNISFRLGLKEGTTLASAESAPRYAIALVKYLLSGTTKYHLIFLRQGEAPDIIGAGAYFSPYNLSSTESSSGGTYELVQYPSQAGGYQQWATNGIVYPVSGTEVPDANATTTSINNVCPEGYKPPSYAEIDSLLSVNSVSGGFYADGYFDRLSFTLTESGDIYYTTADNNTAFGGALIYSLTTGASVFFPFAGYRDSGSSFDITDNGLKGAYWTNTLSNGAGSNPYLLEAVNNNQAGSSTKAYVQAKNDNGPTDCLSIRPVMLISSPTDINGTLDGYTNDDGWE